MTSRYGITAPKAYGVPVGAIRQLGKQLGRDHNLAGASATPSASTSSAARPHAWKKLAPWSRRREEFVKRAAFALLAGWRCTTGGRMTRRSWARSP